jgi:hypothetical protein
MAKLSFPSSTVFNRRVPKIKFYENLAIGNTIKRLFIDQIDTITWQNKLSPATLSVGPGSAAEEIEIFVIRLNQPEISPKILQIIDEGIPYHILFLLKFAGKIAAAIGYKEINKKSNSVNLVKHFITKFREETGFTLELSGLDMDVIYGNFIKQIAGIDNEWPDGYTLREQVDRIIYNEKLEKDMATLRRKMKAETQFNRQVELHEEIKRLLKERNLI